MLSSREIKKYLLRIGINDKPEITLPFLKKLHRQHLLTVPFENLSIYYGEPIILETKKIFEKLVDRNRGGFCYELNGLCFDLLISLGFNAKMISARPVNNKGIPGPEFDHMAIITGLNDEEFLCDVGFGELFIEPVKIKVNEVQTDYGKKFNIFNNNEAGYLLTMCNDGEDRTDQYLFTTHQRELNEFENMCAFHQTSPESHFTQKKVCSLATVNGRVTLSDDRMIINEKGTKKESPFNGEKHFLANLKKYFNIDLQKQENHG